MRPTYFATAIATPNIALIKYWGKRDEKLKLPLNDSISVTLDEHFTSKTTITFSASCAPDTFRLEGKQARPEELKNVQLVLDYLRQKA